MDAPRRFRALSPAGAVVAALVVGVAVAASTSSTVPFDSDEANHANIGLRQFQDLRDGAFVDFLRHSYRTGQFPFLHGWTLLPWFAVLGATTYAARIAQVAWLVLGTWATAFAARRACGDDERAGGLAGWLFATSPLLGAFGGLCMLETPGAAGVALSLAALAAALPHDRRRGALLDVAVAAAVLATWFTKLNYGLWVLPAVGLGYLVAALDRRRRDRALLGVVRYVLLLALVLGAWYSTAEARAQFHGFLTNPAQAVPVVEDAPAFRLPAFSTENFLAYFALVPDELHLHWTLGALVLVLAAAGAWRGVRERNGALVAAAACGAWGWLSLSLAFREYAMARFLAPVLPGIWIAAAAGAAPLLAKLRDGAAARAAEGLVLASALAAAVVQARATLVRELEVDDRFRPVFAHLVEALPAPASVLVVNYTDHTSVRTLVWELGTRPGGSYRDHDVKGLIAERVYESPRAFDSWLDEPRPWGDAAWQSFVVELVTGPGYLDAAVVQPATVALWRDAIERRREGRLELASSRVFEALDLEVRLWRDLRPPPHRGHGGR